MLIFDDKKYKQQVGENDPLVKQYLTESQKYLPKLRNIKATEPYLRKIYLAASKPLIYEGVAKKRMYVKTANLSPYNVHHHIKVSS